MTTLATDKTVITFDYPDWAAKIVTLRLETTVAINSAAEVIAQKDYPITLDANGVGSSTYPTPDSTGALAWLYRVIQPDSTNQLVSIAYHPASQDIATILAASVSTTTPSDLSTLVTNKVSKTGDTMTGALILSGAPAVDLQAATKKYVDDHAGLTTTPTSTDQSIYAAQDLSAGTVLCSINSKISSPKTVAFLWVDMQETGGANGVIQFKTTDTGIPNTFITIALPANTTVSQCVNIPLIGNSFYFTISGAPTMNIFLFLIAAS